MVEADRSAEMRQIRIQFYLSFHARWQPIRLSFSLDPRERKSSLFARDVCVTAHKNQRGGGGLRMCFKSDSVRRGLDHTIKVLQPRTQSSSRGV